MANERNILFQILFKEAFDLVVRNDSGDIIIEVGMDGPGNDVKLLVIPLEFSKGSLAEIAAVGLFSMDKEHRSLDFPSHIQKRLIQERDSADDIPAIGRVTAAGMESALSLVVGVIVFDKPWRIFRKRIHYAAGALVTARTIILCTLGGPGLALRIPCLFTVGAAKISFSCDA